MAITFNTNLSALTSQRYLGIASDKTSSSLAKLSSGSRVPTAKDDAAALAVGSKLRAEVAGLNTAANNAAQAVSLLQIADGALSTVGDILVRMKALAVQSSSGQLADAERSLLNQEFLNLRTEIDRIAQVTNFNGNQLLNGGDVVAATTEAKQGYLAGKGISISYNTAELGSDEVFRVSYDYTDNTTINGTSEADTGLLTVTNVVTGESQTINIREYVQAVTGEALTTDGATTDDTFVTNLQVGRKAEINFDAMGVKLTLDDKFVVTNDLNLTPAPTITANASSLGGTVSAISLQPIGGLTGAQFAAILAGSDFSNQTGLLGLQVDATATANKVTFNTTTGVEFSTDNVTFTGTIANLAVNTANVYVYVRASGATNAFARLNVSALTSGATANTTGTINVDLSSMFRAVESTSTAKSFAFKVGTGVTTNDAISFTLNAGTTSALGISGNTIDTASAATTAITALNGAINTVASRRADIGANQSRLDFAAASIAVAIENTTAAQSGLLDVDVSAEITEFTSQQVLLQAGVSLLAQANQQPALLLRLLQ